MVVFGAVLCGNEHMFLRNIVEHTATPGPMLIVCMCAIDADAQYAARSLADARR